jgi:serine/threonine protein kinase
MQVWLKRALNVFRKFGPTVRFATKLILGVVIPGSPAVIDLIDDGLNWADKQLDRNGGGNAAAPPTAGVADQERLEKLFDTLENDFAPLLIQLSALQGLPDQAQNLLNVALATDERAKLAAQKLSDIAQRFDRLEEQNRALLERQGYAVGLIEEILPLLRRLSGVADFVEDLKTAGLSPGDPAFVAALRSFQEGARHLTNGQVAAAARELQGLADAQPESGTAQAVLAAAQAMNRDLGAARRSLTKAVSLRPRDRELADLERQVTRANAGPTPVSAPEATTKLPRRAPQVGDHLDGWWLEQLLGHGGWGQVFRASRGIQSAALKVMHPELSTDASFVERFRREILTLGGLRGQAHLVEIHDFGFAADCGSWYFVMQLIEGVTLEHHLSRAPKPLTVAQVRRVFLPITQALAVAHARGVVHRDIKPANILLSKDKGQPVLVDFGLATVGGSVLTGTGRSAGYTAMFAAPEQLRGRPADARCDVYALAGSIHYCLTYDRPEIREPDRFEARHVPPILAGLLGRALSPQPDRRYPDADAFARALDQATAESKAPPPVPKRPPIKVPAAQIPEARPVRPPPVPRPLQVVEVSSDQADPLPSVLPPLNGPTPLPSVLPVVDPMTLPAVLPVDANPPGKESPVDSGHAVPVPAVAEHTQKTTLSLKHCCTFRVPNRAGYSAGIESHFLKQGYSLAAHKAGEWTFRRGSPVTGLLRRDVRSLPTTLVVRLTPEPKNVVRVACEYDVWTLMLTQTEQDIAILRAEICALATLLARMG